jgi:hypothetical protein
MPFTNHPENEGFPTDTSQEISLWNVIVQMAQSYETAANLYRETLDWLLTAIGNKESLHELFSNHPELAVKMLVLMSADEDHQITPDHLAQIPALMATKPELATTAVEKVSKMISMRLDLAAKGVEVAEQAQEVLEENRAQILALQLDQ